MLETHLTIWLDWLNENQGTLSLSLFFATILFGWLSGIFAALRRKPKLSITSIEGPTFVCTYGTGYKHEGYDAHRTGIALYLSIANVGAASTSIEKISVGYRWAIIPFRKLWWKYGLFRFWVSDQTVALEDFQAELGEGNIKMYPFLTQRSVLSGESADTFLEVGKSTNGVVYFEQSDSFGGCFPVSIQHRVNLKVVVTDVYGKRHRKKLLVPKVNLEGARKYKPSFGSTLTKMRADKDVFDLPVDHNGNLIAPDLTAKNAEGIEKI